MTAILLTLPAWAVAPLLLANLLGGYVLGQLYFGSIWRSAQRFAAGGGIPSLLLPGLGRLALLVAVLALAAREGALPLLTVAAGLLVARAHEMRRIGRISA